jgi:adenylate cyclase
MRIYEPLGRRSKLSRSTLRECALFELVLARYRARDWDGAERLLRELLDLNRAPLYELYLQRVAALRANEPDPSWDGSYTFTAKEPSPVHRHLA